jgi:hypothetical protein
MTPNVPGLMHLNRLWQAAQMAADLRDLTRQRRTYVFHTAGPITCYLRAEKADVHITRWLLPRVEVQVNLEGAFGWRLAADQDEAGVYLVAHRRRLLGEFSSALFTLAVPHDAHLLLKLEQGRVTLEHGGGLLEIPPPQTGETAYLLTAGDHRN